MTTPNLNPKEVKVLAVLASRDGDFCVMDFRGIARWSGFNRQEVRRACRSLTRKGFAEFYRGCWTEDGEPAGSGYGATKDGRARADAKLVEKISMRRWE